MTRSKDNNHQSYQKYRPDIDGLRAVAVLSVIIFHINSELLPGGFVGVDIFFVISGYLISLYIFREIKNDQFSLTEFYRRRVKRIAPALLVVLSLTLLVSQIILRPVDAEKVAESGLWSLLSLANVYFWLYQDTSYFAASNRELPLLHLWSLGVEEQFYIFWPLLLMLVYKITRSSIFIVSLLLVAFASFGFGELYYVTDSSFVYYMLPTRIGELLFGALVAHLVLTQKIKSLPTAVATLMSGFGVALVAGSLAFLSENNVFPGYQAIPPTLGTAILIYLGHYSKSWLTQFILIKPMIWVGLISYSAYLWHWPLLAFFQYGQFEINLLNGCLIFIITLTLAWLTYKYIEQPLRTSSTLALSRL